MAIVADTLSSTQVARILDLISEGPIVGLVNGKQSIYLNGTPLTSVSGATTVDNFKDVQHEFRTGTETQTAIAAVSASESITSVGMKVDQAQPVVKQVVGENLDAVRVSILIPSLYSTNADNGDVGGAAVSYQIAVRNSSGTWVDQVLRQIWTNTASTSPHTVRIKVALSIDGTVVQRLFLLGSRGAPVSYLAGFYIQRRLAGSSDTWVTVHDKSVDKHAFSLGFAVGYDRLTLLEAPEVSAASTAVYEYDDPTNYQNYEYQVVWTSVPEAPGYTEGVWDSNFGYITGPIIHPPIPFTTPPLTYSWYVDDTTNVITGKATSAYYKTHEFPVTGSGPWEIRVTKTSADSTDLVKRDLIFDSVGQLVYGKFKYPYSALCFLKLDAEQFGSIPERSYDIKGRIVKVPTNYNPVTRTYTGIWNGTFKDAWTDNPAWCYYDLATNTRYGLGEFVSSSMLNKATLYQVAKYCDGMVPDGFGGMEPRFTCNMYLQTREDAYKVLNDMASVFAGMLYWGTGGLDCTQDRPEDPMYSFTNANVIDGSFVYSGSSRNARHTVAQVAYNDPHDKYRRKVEYVEDTEGIAKWGVRQLDMVAFACASRGQAHRLGRRILLSERYLTETVTFKTGLEGSIPYPGAVIQVMDNNRTGYRWGGRIVSATTTSVTIDAGVTLTANTNYTLSVLRPVAPAWSEATTGVQESAANIQRPDDLVETVPVTVVTTSVYTTAINLAAPLSAAPNTQAVWILNGPGADPQLFKVLGVRELDGIEYEITALAYNPTKYAAIENNLKFQPIDYTLLPDPTSSTLPVPSSLTAIEELYRVANKVTSSRVVARWSGRPKNYFSHFEVRYRYTDGAQMGNWISLPNQVTSEAEIAPSFPGTMEVNVRSVLMNGRTSAWATKSITTYGKTRAPAAVTPVSTKTVPGFIEIYWPDSTDIDVVRYEIRTEDANWGLSNAALKYRGATTSYLFKPTSTAPVTMYIRAADDSGNWSPTYSFTVQHTAPAAPASVSHVFEDTSLTAATLTLDWSDVTPPIGLLDYEVSASDGMTTKRVNASTITLPANWVGSRTFYIRARDTVGILSAPLSRTVTKLLPGAPSSPSFRTGPSGFFLLWVRPVKTTLPIAGYEVRSEDIGWGGEGALFKGSTESCALPVPNLGLNTYYVRSYDTDNNYSGSTLQAQYNYTISPVGTNIKHTFQDTATTSATVTLDWSDATPAFGLRDYKVTYGTTTVYTNSSAIVLPANWLGDRTFQVAVRDANSNLSSARSYVVSKYAPNPPQDFRAQVIDNSVMLFWSTPATTTLPVSTFELSKSDPHGDVVLGNKSGVFTTVLEDKAGVYTYKLKTVDTDGVKSSEVQVVTFVAEPPDFKSQGNLLSTFNGTLSNAKHDLDGKVVLPVDTSATWQSHFTSNSWTSPNAQVAAGFPAYAQPSTASGYYEEVFDFQTTLATSRITITSQGVTLSGVVAVTTSLWVSVNGSTWTSLGNVSTTYATNFRYVKVRITVSQSDGGHGLYRLNTLRCLLDLKSVSDAGMVSVVSTDPGGTSVTFGRPFSDIAGITATPVGTAMLTAVVDFTDTLNPTGFKVFLFNSAGARMSGSVFWHARGY